MSLFLFSIQSLFTMILNYLDLRLTFIALETKKAREGNPFMARFVSQPKKFATVKMAHSGALVAVAFFCWWYAPLKTFLFLGVWDAILLFVVVWNTRMCFLCKKHQRTDAEATVTT